MAVENQDYSNILEYRNQLFKSSSSLDFKELNVLHDVIISQTITIAFNKTIHAYGPPPSPFCFFVMGSGGRKEQGIWSDQDHGIIYEHDHHKTRNYFLKSLMDAPTIPYEVQYAQQKLYFPSMQVEDEVVWGLTARMLVSLFQNGLDYKKEWPLLVNSPNLNLK